MAFDVNAFRSNMKLDGARANLFDILLPLPAFAINAGASVTDLQFKAHSAQLPGSTVGVVPLMYFGRELKFAGNRTFQPWTITVYNDEDFGIRNSFESWLNAINSMQGNERLAAAASPISYGVDAVVRQYSKTGNVIKTYQFIGMFPNDVSPIEVSWGSNDQIEEFTVTLEYQYWTDISNTIF